MHKSELKNVGDGWLCEIEMADASQLDGLLDAQAYTALTEG